MNSLKLNVELNELLTLKEFIEKHYRKDMQTKLAVEEIFVNIVNYSNADYIIVNIEYDDILTIEFIDNGIEFDAFSFVTLKPYISFLRPEANLSSAAQKAHM